MVSRAFVRIRLSLSAASYFETDIVETDDRSEGRRLIAARFDGESIDITGADRPLVDALLAEVNAADDLATCAGASKFERAFYRRAEKSLSAIQSKAFEVWQGKGKGKRSDEQRKATTQAKA